MSTEKLEIDPKLNQEITPFNTPGEMGLTELAGY